jgi:hypothetical protein
MPQVRTIREPPVWIGQRSPGRQGDCRLNIDHEIETELRVKIAKLEERLSFAMERSEFQRNEFMMREKVYKVSMIAGFICAALLHELLQHTLFAGW